MIRIHARGQHGPLDAQARGTRDSWMHGAREAQAIFKQGSATGRGARMAVPARRARTRHVAGLSGVFAGACGEARPRCVPDRQVCVTLADVCCVRPAQGSFMHACDGSGRCL